MLLTKQAYLGHPLTHLLHLFLLRRHTTGVKFTPTAPRIIEIVRLHAPLLEINRDDHTYELMLLAVR